MNCSAPAVVTLKPHNFAHGSSARLPLDVDHKIDRFADLRLDVFDGGLLMASHDQIGESPQRLCRRIRMDCGERTRVSGIKGIEQRAGLHATNFAEDDAVGSPP